MNVTLWISNRKTLLNSFMKSRRIVKESKLGKAVPLVVASQRRLSAASCATHFTLQLHKNRQMIIFWFCFENSNFTFYDCSDKWLQVDYITHNSGYNYWLRTKFKVKVYSRENTERIRLKKWFQIRSMPQLYSN